MRDKITDGMISDLREKVRGLMSEKRFAHTLGTEKYAVHILEKIGRKHDPAFPTSSSHSGRSDCCDRCGRRDCGDPYDPDLNKVRAAALLHDFTKEYPPEKQFEICKERKIALRDDEKASPQILHALTAAALIPEMFPLFDDPCIISAVRRHTTGGADMTLFDKIIFLADIAEEGRPYELSAKLRGMFDGNIDSCGSYGEKTALTDKCVAFALESIIERLKKSGAVVNGDSLAALEQIKKNTETEGKKHG